MAKTIKSIRSAFSLVSKVIRRFDILKANTGVVVGISGGIDSLVLLFLLKEYNNHFQQHWDIYACHIDPGFPGWNTDAIEDFCKKLEIPYKIIKIHINKHLQSVEKKCFFCARERRRRLLEYAESLNVFQVALAHHLEDVAETFLLNIIYNGEVSAIVPRQPVIQGRFSFIRPIYYLSKKEIQKIAHVSKFPDVVNNCPYYQISKRQKIKNFLNEIALEYPGVYNSIFNGIRNIKIPYLPQH
ncbi:MAG: tRNA lysidine(34) synthetase [bacterium]